MAELGFVEALARLITDGKTRASFFKDPAATLHDLSVCAEDHASLLALDPHGLEAQAETLLHKRAHEAAPFLPTTWAGLGESAPGLFRFYAEQEWRPDESRPFEDAVRFGDFLTKERAPGVDAAEVYRLKVMSTGRRCAAAVLPCIVRGRPRRALHLFVRSPSRSGRVFGVALFLGV